MSERTQYTIKGIDPEAVTLMRMAAHKEGMKIGVWVSARMKEAAQKSLSIQVGQCAVQPLSAEQVEDRLAQIEATLATIAEAQRRIKEPSDGKNI
jgi:CO/xanthine dehydrogenase FAD-binding subunit